MLSDNIFVKKKKEEKLTPNWPKNSHGKKEAFVTGSALYANLRSQVEPVSRHSSQKHPISDRCTSSTNRLVRKRRIGSRWPREISFISNSSARTFRSAIRVDAKSAAIIRAHEASTEINPRRFGREIEIMMLHGAPILSFDAKPLRVPRETSRMISRDDVAHSERRQWNRVTRWTGDKAPARRRKKIGLGQERNGRRLDRLRRHSKDSTRKWKTRR
ncbi:uncharacterized protein LOC118644568 [Monomorium pharaonis]|uniref:uncharacterized protein LOC118644568 n=1 Tax=Monomorium pharaonis TaxID=307658 RepID=UPI001745F47D|nr:uncharacterized protein LOC118644568 [Monomorium pharaonis]